MRNRKIIVVSAYCVQHVTDVSKDPNRKKGKSTHRFNCVQDSRRVLKSSCNRMILFLYGIKTNTPFVVGKVFNKKSSTQGATVGSYTTGDVH